MNSLKQLRYISLIEGISYLFLLIIGMPLKYGLSILWVNKVLGMIHGILTIGFVVILFQTWQSKRLSFGHSTQVFLASLIPFGAFWAEHKLKKLDKKT